jgi:hypothetical protein
MIPYLLASLPVPRLGLAPTPDPAGLVAACHDLLPPPERRDLRWAAGLDARTDPQTAAGAAWADLEAQVRDALTGERARRLGRDPDPELLRPAGYRADIAVRVNHTFTLADPQQRERALLALRWSLADDLALTAPDGFAALLARAAQTSLAASAARWDSETGWRTLEGMLERWEANA